MNYSFPIGRLVRGLGGGEEEDYISDHLTRFEPLAREQCCQVYNFDRKHTAFWYVVQLYSPMLGRTQNIRLFSTTVQLHCQKYGFLLFSFENQFSKTFLVESINFFLLFAISDRGCDSGGEMLKLHRKVIM